MLLLSLACLGGKDPVDSASIEDSGDTPTDTGEPQAQTVCPPWAGLELGTDQQFTYTDDYKASSGQNQTWTRTVVSHGDWDTGGTLVTVESDLVYEASHIEDYEGFQRTVYGCDDQGAWLLNTYFEASFLSSGQPVETWYESEYDGYLTMTWTPKDGWSASYSRTQTDSNGSFDDTGGFEATLRGTFERTTPAGTFDTVAIDYNGDNTHYFSEAVGWVETPSSWLISF